MSSIDDQIASRLKKLKDETALSGSSSKHNVITISSPSRTNAEQVEELIRRLTEETDIDCRAGGNKCDIDSEIRERLEKLKCASKGLKQDTPSEEPSAEDLVDQYTAEAALEREMDNPGEKEGEELPWCVICNEDGVVKCKACDNDIYCTKCFLEFHEGEDFDAHRPIPYNP